MGPKKSSRITLRFSSKEKSVMEQIQTSGDFEDLSTTIRFCIHFTNTILKILPESIGISFLETEEKEDDSLKKK